MEIDISIRNATPEELQKFFGGVSSPAQPESTERLWTRRELDAIEGAVDRFDAWEHYRAVYQVPRRSCDAVGAMFVKIQNQKAPVKKDLPVTKPGVVLQQPAAAQVKPALVTEPVPSTAKKPARPSTRKGSASNIWSDAEKAAIKDCPDQHAAVKRYRKKFPDSKRRPWAVEQRWFILTKERRGVVPGRVAIKDRLLQKKPENVDASTPAPKKSAKKDGRKIPCPYCKKDIDSRGLHRHVSLIHPDKYSEFLKSPGWQKTARRKIKALTVVSGNDKKPADVGPLLHSPGHGPADHKPTTSQLNCDKITMAPHPDGIVTGIKVHQVKPAGGKIFFGIGTVVSRDGDLVTICNGNGKKYTLDVRNLEIATGPEKKTPEHGRFRDEENPEELSHPEDLSPTDTPPAGDEVTTESLQSDPPGPGDDVKIIGVDDALRDTMPESNPTNLDRRNAHMKAGDRVRHTRGNRLFAGIGTVKRSNLKSGEQLVAFDNGMEWIKETDLDVVPVEVKS